MITFQTIITNTTEGAQRILRFVEDETLQKDTAYGMMDDGKIIEIKVDKKGFKLEELQKLVGGYIEIAKHSNKLIYVVDEEGLMKNKHPNPLVSLLFHTRLVGSVLIMNTKLIK